MSLFGSNLKATILAYEGLFASIGFDFAKSATDASALKAFVDGKISAAATAAKEAAGTELLASLKISAVEGKSAAELIGATISAKDTSLAVYTEGLTAAGVKPAAKQGAALTADDVKTAVENRASGKAATIVAAAGHEGALATQAADTGEPATEAEYVKAIEAEKDNNKKWSLFEAAQKKFGWR
jgi:PAB1-binding protein PBP1